jgi:hypothetical protein
MNPIVITVTLAAVDPQGVGRKADPPTGAYQVRCNGLKPRVDRGAKADIETDLTILAGTSPDAVGQRWNVYPPIPNAGMTPDRLEASSREFKAFGRTFGKDALGKKEIAGNHQVDLGPCVGATGYLWWEPANPEAPEGHAQGYPNRRWLTAEDYAKIVAGELRPETKNTPLKGVVAGPTTTPVA